MNLWSLILSLGEPEERPTLLAFGGLAVALAVARATSSDSLHSMLAIVLLLAVPLLALRLGSRTVPLFLLLASLGCWLVFRSMRHGEPAAAPVQLLNRLAFFAVPPL